MFNIKMTVCKLTRKIKMPIKYNFVGKQTE